MANATVLKLPFGIAWLEADLKVISFQAINVTRYVNNSNPFSPLTQSHILIPQFPRILFHRQYVRLHLRPQPGRENFVDVTSAASYRGGIWHLGDYAVGMAAYVDAKNIRHSAPVGYDQLPMFDDLGPRLHGHLLFQISSKPWQEYRKNANDISLANSFAQMAAFAAD